MGVSDWWFRETHGRWELSAEYYTLYAYPTRWEVVDGKGDLLAIGECMDDCRGAAELWVKYNGIKGLVA